jgi:hypothetical protein
MSENFKYKMRVVRGAFTQPDILDSLGAKMVKSFILNEMTKQK